PASGDLDFSEALGTFTYTPNANFFGNDSFDVIANDGQVDSAVATVDFTVSAVNDVPVVPSVTFNTDEDIPLTDVVMAMDIEGQSSSFIVSETPRKGVISLDPQTGMFTYTPNLNEFGLDEFAVIANDGFGDSLPGRITININQVNDAPELTSFGLLTTDEDVPITGQITGIDPENDVLTYSVSTLPANGSITLSESTGAFAYVPDEDYNGTDLFEITGFDGTDFSAPSPVSVVVLPVNDAPRVTPTQLVVVTGQEGQITLQASDPEGDTLFYLVETAPQFGSAFLDSVTGNLSYTSNPNYVGPDAIIYTVTDGTESTQGSLPISVSADTDGDTVGDLTDNCPNVANEDQSDVDSNGRGDKCDCVTEAFGSSLNPEFFAASGQITPVEEPTTSPTWSLRLNGNGAFVETVAQPSCTTYQYAVQLATGVAPPETMDSFRILVSNDGGPFQLLHQEFGTGFEESFSTIRGLTTGLDVSGDVVFRLEVQSDELSDLFIVDDFFLGCDTDADFLADCVESFLPGYDLTNADADGDGLIDGDEFAAGTDPNAADTDFDGVPDNIDNCGVVPNPMQEDADGNGIGDFCEEFGFFDDFESGTVLDAAMWESSVGEAYVWAPGGVYADGANSLELNGPRSFSSGPPSLGTGINGVATTNPYDFSFCTDAVVNARWVNRDSFSGRDLVIEYNDGSGAWAEIGRAPGAAALNAVNQGAWPITNNGANLSTTAQARLRNDSFTWDDRFYIDNFAFDCDSDADLLGNKLELDVYGTNAFNPDSDGDGVDDGTEIINGTDPLNGSSN
ncbi:MAG: tandem-95 repeat protein, partial [Myxococcota bacterium]